MTDYGGGPSIWPQIALIVILTMINAFFAATEMAVVSLNKNKISQMADDGNKKASTILKLTGDSTKFLSTIQVGITFAGFLSSATASANLSGDLGNFFTRIGVPSGHSVAMVAITLAISYISLVFGELVPKRIALQNAEGVAMATAGVINLFTKIMSPFVAFLSFSTTLVLKITGQYSEDIEEKISEEELKSYITVGQEQGVINSKGKDMMINIFEFDDRMAYEIMTPRTSIYMIEYDEFGLDTVDEILNKGHSRIPVYKDSPDDIVGIINIKDLFIELRKNKFQSIDIEKVMKAPYFIPESKKIDLLLKELQSSKNYIALLIDEYGGLSGLVTMEDIVEEIVGEIEDEYDTKISGIKQIDKFSYIIDGYVPWKTINDELFTNLESENHETIGGFINEQLGYFPEDVKGRNVQVRYKNYRLKVLGIKENRIDKVLFKIEEEDEEI